ncbi:hypothetical protein ACIBKZ_22420 [Streptomyces sp. NPDC050421]|uniref:hypothetical protein n=1 Tax=Streptomyces sp. NPDC050421 TaxID=3365613 RepID=UPI0037A1603A
MSLKDIAARAAILTAIHAAIEDELKTANRELQDGLKAAKKEHGTQTIGLELPDGQDIGKATLVQPKAAATVTDPAAFLAWVREVRPTEVSVRLTTEVRPAWQSLLLKEISAAGRPEWADPDNGVIHKVPGVGMTGRAAYTRMTVPDDKRELIAEAWRSGALAHLALPQITAGGEAP